LKGLAIAWSTLTVVVLIAVAWRYFSVRTGLLLGLFYLALIPNITRLNVTLVGSHPEAVLPCFLVLAAYLECVRRRGDDGGLDGPTFAMGLLSGLAMWVSYASATFVAPLLLAWGWVTRSVRVSALLGAGFLAGAGPWAYQNLWLRPQGALLWREHTGSHVLGFESRPLLEDVVASLGYDMPLGIGIFALLFSALGFLAITMWRPAWRTRFGLAPLALVPVVAAPLAGAVLLGIADLPLYGQGYYHARFFAPLYAALLLVLAIVVDRLATVAPRSAAAAVVGLVLVGAGAHVPLYGTGNGYGEDFEADRARGCSVFGLAEWKRSPSEPEVFARLAVLSGPRCAERAIAASGWNIARMAIESGDPGEIPRLLGMIDAPDHREAACRGARFWLTRTADRLPPDAGEAASRELEESCLSPEPPRALRGHNLILINVDTLRADHLGCYGYARDTSPFIDQLAEGGILFERALSNSSFTRESVSVLFSGRLPTSGASTGWDAAPSEMQPTLAERLLAHGLRTGFFSNTTMLEHPAFTRGFEEFEHLPDRWGVSRAGPALTERALEYVERHAGERFALYLHYLDPHGPYDPPTNRYERFAQSPFPAPVSLYKEVRPDCAALIEEGFGPGDDRFEDLVLRYDAEIADTDAAIELLVKGLEEIGLLEKTLVVLTADHGEEFLEHAFVEHAWTLYGESLHVPLILWSPGALEPQRNGSIVSTVDVLPTLLELMGVPYEGKDFDGQALLKWNGDDVRTVPPPQRFIGELLIRERNVLRTVIEDPFKYIVAYRWLRPEARPEAARIEQKLRAQEGRPPFPLWGPVVEEQLYRLSDDPREERNVLTTYPGWRAKLRRELEAYQKRCEEHGLAPGETPSPDLSPEERSRLRELGYLE
jgi:arylsulfatase